MRVSVERITVGERYVSSRVTVTESHIVGFAGLTGDFNPLHMDEVAARENGFGRRIAHGMLGHSLSTGLRSPIDDWDIIAFMETRRRFTAPILAGDTVNYEAEVSEVRPSRSKPFDVVRVSIRLKNQDGVVVQEGEDVFAVANAEEN
ncbi:MULTISPECIES: MaoC/PaaZ C-terminal domain-containing protein [Achromobacter]|uniref:MaoC/PaaZ C-terminal domain-containing protein n=1 Tax=Achromobacter spanius TaxID=217203 RepID=A0ABY8GLE2_9BURK|nr:MULTISPECIES: MaoC/PaaZ C-terminal domain-containing protein [Achromobacter]WAI85097.1 MaoC/PaaZ C-terminal domain-containing protein [Achromobacter spanius]WEX95179.1 MaoC/PaaZ C-terminal domain-containing protein [Achromobacter sp. SS2-2022]WFP05650.1 MaoC/PaaZ C-terminal domain-containing protein [Achromobacter spanius]